MCNPLNDINAGYQDLDDGKIIRGVITHPEQEAPPEERDLLGPP